MAAFFELIGRNAKVIAKTVGATNMHLVATPYGTAVSHPELLIDVPFQIHDAQHDAPSCFCFGSFCTTTLSYFP